MEGSVRPDGHPGWDRCAGLVVGCSGVEFLMHSFSLLVGLEWIGLV